VLYAKSKQGKHPFRGTFTADDWADVGLQGARGGALGGVAGGSIYLLTNYAGMAAPFAAATVGAARGVGALSTRWQAGDIDVDQFIDLGLLACSDAALVGLATVAGQAVIPLPVLGAVIGSLAGRMLAELATDASEAVARRMQEEMDAFQRTLDARSIAVLQAIDGELDRLGQLTEAAFDPERNGALLASSVALAQAYGVHPNRVIQSVGQVDDFMWA
jgi:hypothetical protein